MIVGNKGQYISDEKDRFLDISKVQQSINTSTCGILMEVIKKSVLTVGSQSAIPNISLLFGVPALEWGNQKHLHTIDYNIKRTKVKFLEDISFSISPEKIFIEIENILKENKKLKEK
jgi:hypothetical protein